MKRLARVVLAAVALAALPACGGGDKGPPPAPKREALAQWQDAFDGVPELFVVVRPQAVKKDGVYGNLFKAAVRAALARERVTGTSALELLEASDEVVLAVHRDEEAREDEVAIVFRGVPASADPGRIVDEAGAPMFRQLDARGKVGEWVPTSHRGVETSLFVLPERTWVLANGSVRARARQAFATPSGRPAPKADERALAVARFGQAFTTKPRFVKSPVFGPLVRKLSSATVMLDPAGAGVRLVLAYEDDESAAYGEMQAKRIAEGLAQSESKRFAWLAQAKVTRGVTQVTVQLPVPPRLLEEMPLASPSDLNL